MCHILGKFIKSWNFYKGMLLVSSVSILEYFLIIPTAKEKFSHINFLKTVCFLSVVITIYSILTYGQANIDSDIAMPSFLARTIWVNKSLFPQNWSYANGDVWVISIHLFVLPFTILLENQSLARMLGASLLILVTLFGPYYQDKKIFKCKSWTVSIPLFLMFLQGQDTLRWIRLDNLYTIYMLFITILSTQIILIYNNKGNKKMLIIFLILSMILTITGIRMLSYFTLPFCLTFLFVAYMKYKNTESFEEIRMEILKLLKLISIIIIPAIIGFVIHTFLTVTNITNNGYNELTFIGNVKEIQSNLLWYFETLFQDFGFNGKAKVFSVSGFQNIITLVCFFLIVFFIPILQLKKLKYETEEVRIFYIFGFFHSLINFIVIVFFGKTAMTSYVLTTIYICILISSRYIMVYWLNKKTINRGIILFIYFFFFVIQLISTYMLSKRWVDKLVRQKKFTNQLVEKGLYKGYGTYWNAYNNNLYSDYRLKIAAIDISENKIEPFKWLTDISWFNVEKNIKTFLILSKEENERMKSKIEVIFGKPQYNFLLDEKNIYVFDHDIIIDFPNGLKDKRLLPKELMWNDNVVFENKELLINPKGITFGPYVTLNKGRYLLTIYGENLDKASIDIFSQTSNDEIIYNIDSILSNKVVLKLDIKNDVNQLEFRIFNYTDKEKIKLAYMEINQ